MVKNLPCNAWVSGLIPSRGSKIPHAKELERSLGKKDPAQPKKKKKKKFYNNYKIWIDEFFLNFCISLYYLSILSVYYLYYWATELSIHLIHTDHPAEPRAPLCPRQYSSEQKWRKVRMFSQSKYDFNEVWFQESHLIISLFRSIRGRNKKYPVQPRVMEMVKIGVPNTSAESCEQSAQLGEMKTQPFPGYCFSGLDHSFEMCMSHS